MNARLHAVLKYLYAFFLLASGLKHLYNVYVADPTIMATGYPEPEATAFVLAMLETKFLLPFICTVKLIAAVLLVLPGREQLGVLMAFPYALGMFMWAYCRKSRCNSRCAWRVEAQGRGGWRQAQGRS